MKALFDLKLDRLDVVCWIAVLLFFGISTVMLQGDFGKTLLGASGVVFLMLLISHSVEILLSVLRGHPRAGEIAGYVTNGPEALVMIVGLIHGKLLFAAGVPLGSNFANPVLLVIAGLISRQLSHLFLNEKYRTEIILAGTLLCAGLFYLAAPAGQLWFWVAGTLVLSLLFYRFKGHETHDEEFVKPLAGWYIIPAALLLVGSGYFIDPVVSFTADASRVPDGAIAFFVLSFISSWPEFRSVISLIRMRRFHSAIINILISNITNLWLAVIGVSAYLLLR